MPPIRVGISSLACPMCALLLLLFYFSSYFCLFQVFLLCSLNFDSGLLLVFWSDELGRPLFTRHFNKKNIFFPTFKFASTSMLIPPFEVNQSGTIMCVCPSNNQDVKKLVTMTRNVEFPRHPPFRYPRCVHKCPKTI